MFNSYPYTDFHELNLDWIITHFKEFVDEIASLDSWRTTHEAEYQQLKEYVDELRDGQLTPAMYNAIVAWCNANLFDLFAEMIKFITVSLNDSGYIVLTYPSQWRELVFNTTGLDIDVPLQPEYGHLTISY